MKKQSVLERRKAKVLKISVSELLFFKCCFLLCCCCCCWLSGGDRFLSHHELRPSVGPVLNPYPHNGVCACVCVSAQGRGVCICICICMCCEQSLSSLFYFAGHTAPPGSQHWPSRLNRPIQAGSQ